MPKFPSLSGEDTARALEKLGFGRIRQKGSHLILRKSLNDLIVGCVVPMHRELAQGTLRSILRQGQISQEVFMAVL